MSIKSKVLAIAAAAAIATTGAANVKPVDPAVDSPLAKVKGKRTLVLAGGCFWGIEAVFEHVKGVTAVTVGYSGGSAETANYEAVSNGSTGHAESVRITYDPSQITYGQLLKVFFFIAHDPTELNRQGPDTGTQYRSVIFYSNDEQRRIAQTYLNQLNQAHVFGRPIVTQIVGLEAFYNAESYHQDFATKHPDDPYIVINDLPKVDNLQQQLPALFVSRSGFSSPR